MESAIQKHKTTQRLTMRPPLKVRMCGLRGILAKKKTRQILVTTRNTPTSLLLNSLCGRRRSRRIDSFAPRVC